MTVAVMAPVATQRMVMIVRRSGVSSASRRIKSRNFAMSYMYRITTLRASHRYSNDVRFLPCHLACLSEPDGFRFQANAKARFDRFGHLVAQGDDLSCTGPPVIIGAILISRLMGPIMATDNLPRGLCGNAHSY
jgi:hypothetical protein